MVLLAAKLPDSLSTVGKTTLRVGSTLPSARHNGGPLSTTVTRYLPSSAYRPVKP